MADGQLKIDVVVRSISELNKLRREMGNTIGRVKLLSTGIGSLGNRLGFVAFQFTFMAGVAGRALSQIRQNIQRTVEEAAKAEDQVIRAISQSGIDVTQQIKGSAEAIKFLNDAIRDFGSGRTIFNTQEVAEAAKELGRAFNFVGTQEDIAVQNVLVLKGALRLMTIEQIGAEKAAINLSKVMKTFGKSVAEVNDVVNTLVVVNQQSSITLDGLVRSLAFAGSFAREFGISMEETAVILGVIQDRLGRTEGGPGQNFRVLLENLSRVAISTNKQLRSFGVEIRNSDGQLNNIVDIVRQFRDALNAAGKEGSLARQFIAELGTRSVRARTALLNLIQGFDDLEVGLKNLEDLSFGEKLEALFTETAEARIKRLKATINSLKIDFTSGLSPALVLITTELRKLVTEGSGFAELVKQLGTELGNTMVPIIKTLVKFVKALSTSFKSNELLVSLLTKGFVGLLGVLAALFIVGTLGALFALMASGLQRMTVFLGLTQVAALGAARAFLPLFIAGLGVFLALKAIDNIIGLTKDGLIEGETGALAMNSGLLALGATLTAVTLVPALRAVSSVLRNVFPSAAVTAASAAAYKGSLTKAFPGINTVFKTQGSVGGGGFAASFGSKLTGITSKLKGLLVGVPATSALAGSTAGGGFSTGFLQKAKLIQPGTTRALTGLGKAGIIGAAIAGGLLIGLAIKDGIDKKVNESIIFNKKFVDKATAVAFQTRNVFTASFADSARFALDVWADVYENILAGAQTVGKGLSLAWQRAWRLDFVGAQAAIDAAILQLGKDLQIEATLMNIHLSTNAVANARDQIAHIFDEIDFRDDLLVAEAIQEILTDTGAHRFIDASNLRAILKEIDDVRDFQIGTQNIEKIVRNVLGLTNEEGSQETNPDLFQPPTESNDAYAERIKEQIALYDKFGISLLTGIDALNAKNINDMVLNEAVVNEAIIRDATSEELIAAQEKLAEYQVGVDAEIDAINAVTVEDILLAQQLSGNTEVTKEQIAAVADLTTGEKVQLKEIKINSKELVKNSGQLDLDSQTLNKEVIEIANNINRMIDFTVQVDKAAIAFSLLAREGAEAARRLASITVSEDGIVSMSGRRTAGVSGAQVTALGSDLGTLNDQLNSDLSREKIALDSLKLQEETLDAINTFEGDLKILTQQSIGQAASSEEFQKIVEFGNLLRSLDPSDSDIKALVDTFNRQGNTRNLREILGSSLEPFIESILERDVDLTGQLGTTIQEFGTTMQDAIELEAKKLTDLERVLAFTSKLEAGGLSNSDIQSLLDQRNFNAVNSDLTLRDVLLTITSDLKAYIDSFIGATGGAGNSLLTEPITEPSLPDLNTDPNLRHFGDEGGGLITNNITVNVEGLTDETTAEDVANRVVDIINNSIQGRNTLRR